MADGMFLDRNRQWAKPGPYETRLPPDQEAAFHNWRLSQGTVATPKGDWSLQMRDAVSYDPRATADYDMRGYYQAQQAGQAPGTSTNANDGQQHFTDQFKTPYHESFSRESQYAQPNAPQWNPQDQLVDEHGNIVYDERAAAAKRSMFQGD